MKTIAMVLGVLAVIALLLASAAAKKRRKNGRPPIARTPLTKREQPMFFRLQETFPEHIVLAQVAFSALITARERAIRNAFDRKVADFVLCTKAFEVVAVIELDDSSHKGREANDANRSRLLTTAGHRVLRFKQVPNVESLRTAVTARAAAT